MKRMTSFLQRYPAAWPIIGSIIFFILIGQLNHNYSSSYLFTATRLSTFALLLGLAQMVVVTSGDGAIDLSQIYILTLCAYASTTLMFINPVLGLLAAVLIGGLAGFINGVINVYLKVPAMVTTLATGYLYLTLVLVASSKMKVLPIPGFVSIITRNYASVSVQTFIAIAVAGVLAILMYRTKYGKQLHAVGQNRNAAYLAGIPTSRVVLTAFVIGGLISGLAGVLAAAVMGGSFQDMGSSYFLPSIAATFVGGTAASGGKSSALGVSFGALMMTLMSSFLDSAQSNFGLASGIKQLVMGIFLVSILLLSVANSKKKSKRMSAAI